ncbi:MAG: ThiF family adenylyltransferase [Planctomycetes bacterium]|nr:ThiF family adenylyltransferase [Planctomycetota bacterium]MCB9885270.1 ThiF family adenylyltransferase [Planctomycetota bacterium]
MRVHGVGETGQRRLASATVLIVGCGALGSHSAQALVRAGVGTVWLVDRDIVELSNLQRQVLFSEADAIAGVPKAIAAAAALGGANSACRVVPHVADCSLDFLRNLPARPDLVLDGTDNFPTRYLLNDWCAEQGVPWIYAGAVGSEGAAMVVPAGGPCLRCLWPEAPQGADVGNCETVGILQPAIAAVTAFQVAEALKLLVGAAPTRGVFTCDVWRGQYLLQQVADRPAPDCPVCRRERFPALLAAPTEAVTLCGRDAVQIDPGSRAPIDLAALAARLDGAVDDLRRTAHLLRFAADGCRFSVFPGGRTLVFGVQDPLRARALFDRWVGAHGGAS